MNTAPATHPAFERHYTVVQLAKLWGLSHNTVYKMFADVDGVVRYRGSRSSGALRKVTMRIPASVAVRVHAAHSQRADFFRKPTGRTSGKKSSLAVAASRSL